MYYEILIYIFLFFLIILISFLIAAYILNTISYTKIFKTYNYKNLGYAWVPILRVHILGLLTFDDPVTVFSFSIKKEYVVWWWVLIFFAILIHPIIGCIISLFLIAKFLGKIYNIVFKKLDPSYDKVALGIKSALIPMIMWVKVLSNKTS
ncbi:MAG: hypothetical protein Q4F88_01300 [Eubacteriales bacterium]|nr:hypothetical protein [Eubacteriales bacterium]